MVTGDLERWGLHELEGSGYFANDAGSSDVKPGYNVDNWSSGIKPVNEATPPRVARRAEIRTSDIGPVNAVAPPSVVKARHGGIEPVKEVALPVVEISSSDIVPVNDLGEPIVQRVHVPSQYSAPPLQSPPNTVNDALIAQALHEEFQKLAAAEAAGQTSAKEKV
jgi:hypothetical protein